MSDHDLGLVHRVGVTWRFGGFSAEASAEPAVFSPTGSEPVTRFALKARTRAEATGVAARDRDVSGLVVRTYAGQGPPPADIVWDGKDAAGRPLPDGLYTYRLRVDERGGTSLQARPGMVEISQRRTARRDRGGAMRPGRQGPGAAAGAVVAAFVRRRRPGRASAADGDSTITAPACATNWRRARRPPATWRRRACWPRRWAAATT